jgi:hypothetical protein
MRSCVFDERDGGVRRAEMWSAFIHRPIEPIAEHHVRHGRFQSRFSDKNAQREKLLRGSSCDQSCRTVSAMIDRALVGLRGAWAHGVAGAEHILVKAMFGQLRTRWREARATRLKRQFENASLYVRDLGEE